MNSKFKFRGKVITHLIYPIILGFIVMGVGIYEYFDNKISLKGADSSYYEHNKNVLLKIFDSNNCTISDTNIHCSAYGMYANAFQNGYVEVGYSYWNCYVSEKGNSLCSFGK